MLDIITLHHRLAELKLLSQEEVHDLQLEVQKLVRADHLLVELKQEEVDLLGLQNLHEVEDHQEVAQKEVRVDHQEVVQEVVQVGLQEVVVQEVAQADHQEVVVQEEVQADHQEAVAQEVAQADLQEVVVQEAAHDLLQARAVVDLLQEKEETKLNYQYSF